MDAARLTDWETDEEFAAAAAASLPTPSGTPYRTPSRTSRRSRQSSRQNSVSPPRSSPPPLPTENNRNSRDFTKDLSVLDPRRFTPTLHANLVSEILSLRRDQEEKIKVIEGLEESLQTSREETEAVEHTLAATAKESRALKKQLLSLEGDTSSALGEIARQRDEAVTGLSEVKKRLDTTQKKVRQQEDDSNRVHHLWNQDKENWENERRALERRLHVAEGRLKTVLDEVASFHVQQTTSHENEGEEEGTIRGSDTASVRSLRFSLPHGASLADELNFDDDETDQESVISMGHQRTQSRDSMVSRRHFRNQSIDSLRAPGTPRRAFAGERLEEGIFEEVEYADTGVQVSPLSPESTSGAEYVDAGVQHSPSPEPISSIEYVDTGVQFSPPPSPEPKLDGSPALANQARKRIPLELRTMVSTSSQTHDGPLSPPRTPKSPTRAPPPIPLETPVMVSMATQTDLPSTPSRAPPPPPIPIPSISVVPPTSAPATPRESLLPSQFRDAACQASIQTSSTREASVQTEEIRVDERIKLLPVHLQPSSIRSTPPSPEPNAQEAERIAAFPGGVPPRNPRRVSSQRSIPSSPPIPTIDSYPGNNDNGPLGKDKAMFRRPPRVSSLFAGFDVGSSDEAEDFDGELSDGDYRTVLSPPVVPMGKRTSVQPPMEDLEPVEEGESPEEKESLREPQSKFSTTARQPSIRRSSALPVDPPPFPIPTRASSRNPVFSSSAPSDGTRSPTPHSGDPWTYHRRSGSRSLYRNTSVRKVRSAAAMPRGSRYRRHGSRSPPPMSASTAPESPQLPPMPYNDVTTPRYRHRHQPSTNTAYTANTTNTAAQSTSSSQSTGVVDAIAQTMVGEWMWKYVRRRKSFTVSEPTGDDTNGIRHKRWVWLAPYERAVLWSSKQPTSGPALLGKSGRKLIIQSVLDVKDDNPGPKGQPPVFNRSILILTPARALKFTASTRERHYLWLTALSFLAHSSQTIPDIAPAPIPAVPDFEGSRQTARLRKNPIRDSIRIAKNKSVLGQPSVQTMNDEYAEAADPPVVHRFSDRAPVAIHSRKRSNTGPRMPPPLSFRGFSERGSSYGPSSIAGLSSGSSDIYQSQPPSILTRTSDASSRPGQNFFDAVGTVRMEAFISPLGVNRLPEPSDYGFKTAPVRRRSRDRRRRTRRPSRDEYWSGSKTAGEEEWYDARSFGKDDPFRGF